MKIKIAEEELEVDPNELAFTEATINEKMERLGSLSSFYGQKFADAEYYWSQLEKAVDNMYMAKFVQYKDEGRGSDKVCEALAKIDPIVIELSEKALNAKKAKIQLQQYLKAIDITHQNVQSRGHMIRKEMEKLQYDIRTPEQIVG